jgi:hypothetical protein
MTANDQTQPTMITTNHRRCTPTVARASFPLLVTGRSMRAWRHHPAKICRLAPRRPCIERDIVAKYRGQLDHWRKRSLKCSAPERPVAVHQLERLEGARR